MFVQLILYYHITISHRYCPGRPFLKSTYIYTYVMYTYTHTQAHIHQYTHTHTHIYILNTYTCIHQYIGFARHNRHWTLAEWKKVLLFLDECTKQQFVRRHIRRHLGKRFDKNYVVATMKHPQSQMIVGAMSYYDAALCI